MLARKEKSWVWPCNLPRTHPRNAIIKQWRKSSRVRWVTRCCIQFLCAVRKSCGVRNVCSATQTSFMHPLPFHGHPDQTFYPDICYVQTHRLGSACQRAASQQSDHTTQCGLSHGVILVDRYPRPLSVNGYPFKLLLDYRLTRNCLPAYLQPPERARPEAILLPYLSTAAPASLSRLEFCCRTLTLLRGALEPAISPTVRWTTKFILLNCRQA